MDGFVDIYGDNVTLSWNRVLNWDNVHLLNGADKITFHHNLFRDSAGRQPKASGATDVHAYNNWLDNWGYDGMRITSPGEIRADSNVFTPGGDTRAIEGRWAGSGNAFLNGASADGQSSGGFTPPYSYSPDPVGTSAEQQALRDRLESEAGWQSSFGTTPPPIPDFTPPSPPANLRVR